MLNITWLGHSAFELKLAGGEVCLLDPWLADSGNPMYPHGHSISRVDVIALSHAHFDHLGDTVALAKKFSPKVVAMYELCHWLDSKGVANTCPMNKGGTQQAGPLSFTMTHALHSGGILEEGQMLYGGEPCGYVLTLPDGRSAYFAGDTTVFSDMALIGELYRPELAFLPIGDLFTMGPREAALACRMLKPKKVIPMHWGTFPPLVGRPEQLAALTADFGVEVWALAPGQTVQW